LFTHARYIKLVSRVTGISKKEVERISQEAFPLSAERAKSLGIVHEIV
jgi:ATP-dependent protease ClpP protease subunit